MFLRRLVALLSSATMLHLSVTGGDAACAQQGATTRHHAHGRVADHPAHVHDAATSSAEVSTNTSHALSVEHGVHVARVAASSTPTPPEGAPGHARCCESMASCSVSGTVVQHVAIVPSLPDASLMAPAPTDAPTSVRQAPEPPPPKA